MARGLGVKPSSPFARVAIFTVCAVIGILVFVLSPGGGSEPIELYLVEAAARGRSAARRVIRKYSEAAQIDGELPNLGDALKLKPAGRIVAMGAAHTRGHFCAVAASSRGCVRLGAAAIATRLTGGLCMVPRR